MSTAVEHDCVLIHAVQVTPLQRAQPEGGQDMPVRYTVLEVHDSRDEKLLRLVDERRGCQHVAVHLRDGWQGTPAQTGDTVHVLARIDVVDGRRRAVCDHSEGAGCFGERQPDMPDT